MDNYHVVEYGNEWILHAEGNDTALISADTKAELLSMLPEYMQGRTGSVKIHTATGHIAEERTYPRSADPQRSKG
ncbi:DUF2188 domain-containing protein [Pseudomonas asiatica]|uniref:DUF2188 domain-containing protein n=1 Tax=Pseudomonas asiatica TaxID=2219225 RepID=UPI0025AB277C|nr:DUF2188 domain-containing protein [Pseudomonas asiatica]MDM9591638.1 DUF2188 domain-containing protein [Pseudomonas asiatica]